MASGTNLTFDPGSLDQYIAEFRFALRAVEPVRTEMGEIFQGNIAPVSGQWIPMPLSNTSAAVTSLKREFGRVGVQLRAACGGGIGGSGGDDEK